MSETAADLRRKMNSAGDLGSVVRMMKALAGSRIREYQNAVLSLKDYYHTVELGLLAYLLNQRTGYIKTFPGKNKSTENSIIVLGSDQGLIGQFNETLTDFVAQTIKEIAGTKKAFVVGEKIQASLEKTGIGIEKIYKVPNTVLAITPMISTLLLDAEFNGANKESIPLYIFYNHPLEGANYAPVFIKLLPLDAAWEQKYYTMKWPAKNLPEVLGAGELTFEALAKEYLFVSMFRACAESMASENASRLAAMQRAEKNINTLLEEMNSGFNRMRQDKIDEELFDVISGFNAMK